MLYAIYGHYSEEDKAAYDKIVKGEIEENALTETQISRQRRLGLEKSIFFYDKGQRLELKVKSEASDLALEKTDRHVEVVEHLQNMTAILQESVDTSRVVPQQIVLMLEAGSATYRYKGGFFSANDVHLQRYLVSNQDLTTANLADAELISEGSAASVSFSIDGKIFDFNADHFKGEFALSQNRSIKQEEKVSISADQMHYLAGSITLSGHAVVSSNGYSLAADLIVLQLSDANPHRKAEKNTIRTITADGEVRMNGLDFVATSDRAIFHRDPQASEGVLPGTITLTCYSPERLCTLTNHGGDTILSNKIIIDTLKQEALFADPKGTLKTFEGTFSSKKMVWDEPTSRLTLSGDVVITFEVEDEDGAMIPSRQSYGKLKADNDVRVILTTVDGKKVLRGMDTVGDATLIFIDPETGADYLLKSYGSFRIDHQKMEGKLLSPVNADGSVIEGKQIFFEDAKGQMSADKAFVKYAYVDKRLVPTRVVLKGHVKMSNHPERSDEDHTTVDQYILSDRVDFIPQTKEMVFKAAKGERVLLFDQDNHLEVSAPGIKLIRDKAVRKDTIQGLGDVRFNFVESELEQFRHHFPFEKKSEAKK